MSNFFGFFKKGFSKTADRVATIFGQAQLDEDSIEELEEMLYTADFGVETTEEVIDTIRSAYKKDKSFREKSAGEIGAEVLIRQLEGSEGQLKKGEHQPHVICMIGVNGSGKTTSCAKLGKHLQDTGHSVLIAAADTFRAAANEQLKEWCDRLGLPLIASQQGADAAAVAYDAYAAARARNADYLIIDTAGRLHTKSNLMDELAKIKRVLAKQDSEAPHSSWLVVDGSIGSNSIQQARVFNDSFPLSGLIVTKLDGTSKGGAIVAIYRELQKPVYYVGLGEKPEDLKPFDREDYSRAVFGLSEL